jgi:hypothetical protein
MIIDDKAEVMLHFMPIYDTHFTQADITCFKCFIYIYIYKSGWHCKLLNTYCVNQYNMKNLT